MHREGTGRGKQSVLVQKRVSSGAEQPICKLWDGVRCKVSLQDPAKAPLLPALLVPWCQVMFHLSHLKKIPKKVNSFTGLFLAGSEVGTGYPSTELLLTEHLIAMGCVPAHSELCPRHLHLPGIFKKPSGPMFCAAALCLLAVNTPLPEFLSPGFPTHPSSDTGKCNM